MAKRKPHNPELDLPDTIEQMEFSKVIDGAFTKYAYKVIEDRAIPDARDGMKPSQRRILYAMDQLGLAPTKKHMKCAKIVGETMGNYHPHGNLALYGTLVGMAQPWGIRTPLVDPQGNFGSVDGDNAAAERYTEARLSYAGAALLEDLSPRVVRFKKNYDESREEPSVLPAKLPNLLLNGCSGIAVGYATNIPPHNLRELARVFEAFIKNPNITPQEIIKIMPGPDFPTGGALLGQEGVLEYYQTGKGSIKLEGIYTIEPDSKGNDQIIITEFPEGGAPEKFREEVKDLIDKGKIGGISDIANYSSNKIGTRVIVEIGRNGNVKTILNQILSHTCLRVSFSVNSTVLINGKLYDKAPITVLVKAFIDHRTEVLTNKFNAELADSLERIEILEGLLSVASHIDEAIKIVRASENPEAAAKALIERKLVTTERQAKAVLAITLAKLTKLEHNALLEEKKKKEERVAWLNKTLANVNDILSLIIQEQKEIAEKLGDDRRTKISGSAENIIEADLIPVEDVVVCITTDDCIKRVPLKEYRKQNRGGVGVSSGSSSEDFCMQSMFAASTHDDLLCFTDGGRAFSIKVFELPETGRTAKGRPIINFINLKNGERICAYLPIKGLGKSHTFLNFISENGLIKRAALRQYANINKGGVVAVKVKNGDRIVTVLPSKGIDDLLLVTHLGMSIRFSELEVRIGGRQSSGVTGIKIGNNDKVVGGIVVPMKFDKDGDTITSENGLTMMTFSTRGFGKRTNVDEYLVSPVDGGKLRQQSRGGKGRIDMNIEKKTGNCSGVIPVRNGKDIVIITKQGQMVRIPGDSIKTTYRGTSGVRIVKLGDNDEAIAASPVAQEVEE
jgi:DNA gyrase subunit A